MWVAIRKLVGNGLLGSEGDLWREQRTLIQPAFHRQRLAALTRLMSATTLESLLGWRDQAADGKPVDMMASMFELTMQIIVRAIFGSKLPASEARELGDHFTTALGVMQTRMMAFMLPGWIPLPGDQRLRESLNTIDTVIFRLIAERKAQPPTEAPQDLLDMLLAARDAETGAGMSDVQLRDELFTMFLAGHETSGSVLSWVWTLLSQHPAVEQRLQAEVEAVLGDRVPTYADLPNLVYTRAVIDETMRLYPPAWLVPRTAQTADNIRGTEIPAGATMLISLHSVHRHPAFWPDADRFDPERFLEAGQVQREAYLPFGDGPRQCIGVNLAMMEMQLIVAMTVQAYQRQMLPEVQVKPKPLPALRPDRSLLMTLTPRTLPMTGKQWLLEAVEREEAPAPVEEGVRERV
jgi:cytochrome P450